MVRAASESKQAVEAYAALWNNQEYENIPDVVSQSYVLVDPVAPAELPGPAGEIHGPDGLEQYIRAVMGAFPDMEMTLDEMVVHEGTVMTEETVTGTHTGELFGLPPTDRVVKMKEMQKYHIVNGKVESQAVYYNVEEMKAQLGLTFPAIVGQLPKLVWRKIR